MDRAKWRKVFLGFTFWFFSSPREFGSTMSLFIVASTAYGQIWLIEGVVDPQISLTWTTFILTMDSDGLKSIPLGQLMEMRKNGQELRGMKLESRNVERRGWVQGFEKGKKPKRANKNAPQELSSKQRPKSKRLTVEKREVRGICSKGW